MKCKEFIPGVCDIGTRGTICASSQTGYIAASVTSTLNCSFQYTIYLEQYNPVAQLWMNVASRTGVASKSGTSHEFTTNYADKREFRVRCVVLATNVTGTTDSFSHL
ncbi:MULTISPECIES: hypothetical protein [unclassified Sporosarcina]|uniref:hypothetical protein n=1 Tax=unclassified Sporosarcina TaxID=2647733 RepID=UPI001A938E93|nr:MULTISPECIES: hypothetical protein [unclassified Sporosarcina]MBO0587610.1 hypothetical protein [Sporosarcina sp. E16_8]MBO0602400.1 hypothetical protein [Sporosarcina sp. E16_3]